MMERQLEFDFMRNLRYEGVTSPSNVVYTSGPFRDFSSEELAEMEEVVRGLAGSYTEPVFKDQYMTGGVLPPLHERRARPWRTSPRMGKC